jgi:murein DD-endopeptidase MepM/ murein hydrolase activator NlpD
VGSTGNVTEAQLHFGIREGKRHVNPEELLPRRFAGTR